MKSAPYLVDASKQIKVVLEYDNTLGLINYRKTIVYCIAAIIFTSNDYLTGVSSTFANACTEMVVE